VWPETGPDDPVLTRSTGATFDYTPIPRAGVQRE
jgi:hypothetical protein